MYYSLFSRFQGCLLGAALGEGLDSQMMGSRVVVEVAEALLRSHRWEEENTLPTLPFLPGEMVTDGGLAIATLPMMLFFHDDLALQQRHLRQAIQVWGGNLEQAARVLLFGYAIAQILKAQLQPSTFLAQAQAYLRISGDGSAEIMALLEELRQLDRMQQQGMALKTVAANLSTHRSQKSGLGHPTATNSPLLALYAFLSTPDAFHLSLARSVQGGDRSGLLGTLTGALAGALSGAYNSSAGIPATWLHSAYSAHSGVALAQIRHLSARLLTGWSGGGSTTLLEGDVTAVSAPWSIRSR